MKHCLLLAAITFLFTSCGKDHWFDCLKGSGEQITVHRSLTYFHSIEMHNKADVIYRKGLPQAIITGGANLLEGIETRVENGWLIIRNNNKCNWVRDFNKRITIEVFTDTLVRVDNYGSGNFTAEDTITVTDFRYDNWNATGNIQFVFNVVRFYMNIHTGTSDLSARGIAEVQILYYNGYGFIDLLHLNGNLIYMNNSGTNDMYVNVKNELNALIEEAGNIYYAGNPASVNAVIKGTGKLIKIQ
jgi:hypothetical protein